MRISRRRPVLSTWLAAALIAPLVLGVSGCKNAADNSPPVAVAVKAQHPEIGPISEEIAADAILAPLSQAALAPKISAPVREFYVQRGAHVHKGELLASLEDRDLTGSALDSKGSLSAAEAAYETAVHATIPEEDQRAQLDVDQAKANLDVARRTADERKRLLDQGAIAGRDVDTAIAAQVQAQATYDIAVKHLHSVDQTIRIANAKTAEGQLTSAKGRYESAEALVSYSALRSPIDGVVTDRPLFAGETAAAGVPVITVMDTSSLLAKLHLAQSAAQKLKLGGGAEIQVAGIDEPVKGNISFISPALDAGSTTVEVWLKLPNSDGALKVGTPVHVVITGRTIQDALQVPVLGSASGTRCKQQCDGRGQRRGGS